MKGPPVGRFDAAGAGRSRYGAAVLMIANACGTQQTLAHP